MAIIIDAGACIGQWLQHQGIDSESNQFYCFEPLQQNFDKLWHGFGNRPNVVLVKSALGGFNGTIPIYVGPAGNEGAYWGSTICKDKSPNWVIGENVITLKLSDYWKQHINQKVNLLKMNIEGAEYDVLEDLLDAGIINQFETIRYQDHGVRGEKSDTKPQKIIPSCRDKAFEVFPRLQAEFKGRLEFLVRDMFSTTTDIPEYLR